MKITRKNIIKKSFALIIAGMLPVKLSSAVKKDRPIVKTVDIKPVEWKDGTWALEMGGSGNRCFFLNTTAKEIWDLIDSRKTQADISMILAEKYNVPSEEIHVSVNKLISSMRNQRLLV